MREAKVWAAMGGGLAGGGVVGTLIAMKDFGVRPESTSLLSTYLALGFAILAGVVAFAAALVLKAMQEGSKPSARLWARLALLLCIFGGATLVILYRRIPQLTPTLPQIYLGFVAGGAILSGIVLSTASRIMASCAARPVKTAGA